MKKIIFLALICLAVSSCNNDDDMDPNTCNVQGFTFSYGNESGFIPESDLTTELDPNGSPALMEIYGFVGPDTVVFTAPYNSDGGDIIINGLPSETISASLDVSGTNVGDLIRYSLTGTYQGQPLTGEFCVVVDLVRP